jgi:hypothetical protein
MANDQFDEDDDMNRRAETVQIRMGSVFARTCGDPANPLMLYVHGAGQTSMAWNNLVTNLSIAKRESHANALLGRKGVLKEMKGEPNQDAKGEAKGGKAKGTAASGSSGAGDKAAGAAEGGVEGKRGKEGRGKDVVANDEGAEGRDEDDYDDRFAVLRGKLAKALLRRQRELAQTLCSLCKSPLLRPTRLVACRHVLCALCVERSILYHRVCPVCATPNGAPECDSEHDKAMCVRMETLRDEPLMVTAWRARLDEHEAERRSSLRLVIEFGSTLAGAGDSTPRQRTKASIFVGLLRAKGGTLVHRGCDCTQQLDDAPNSIIAEVVLNYNPESTDDADSTVALTQPSKVSDQRVDYIFTRPMRRGATVHIRVHWGAEIGVAPLQIVHKLGRETLGRETSGVFARHIVVQLPRVWLLTDER